VMSQNLIPIVASDLLGNDGSLLVLQPGHHSLEVNLGTIEFNAGLYPLTIAINDVETQIFLLRLEATASFRVINDRVDWGFISRQFHAIHAVTEAERIAIPLNDSP
jgi:hypothetical protein